MGGGKERRVRQSPAAARQGWMKGCREGEEEEEGEEEGLKDTAGRGGAAATASGEPRPAPGPPGRRQLGLPPGPPGRAGGQRCLLAMRRFLQVIKNIERGNGGLRFPEAALMAVSASGTSRVSLPSPHLQYSQESVRHPLLPLEISTRPESLPVSELF